MAVVQAMIGLHKLVCRQKGFNEVILRCFELEEPHVVRRRRGVHARMTRGDEGIGLRDPDLALLHPVQKEVAVTVHQGVEVTERAESGRGRRDRGHALAFELVGDFRRQRLHGARLTPLTRVSTHFIVWSQRRRRVL